MYAEYDVSVADEVTESELAGFQIVDEIASDRAEHDDELSPRKARRRKTP